MAPGPKFHALYTKTQVTRTLKGNEKQFELAGNSKQLFEFELSRFYFAEIFHQSNILVTKSFHGQRLTNLIRNWMIIPLLKFFTLQCYCKLKRHFIRKIHLENVNNWYNFFYLIRTWCVRLSTAFNLPRWSQVKREWVAVSLKYLLVLSETKCMQKDFKFIIFKHYCVELCTIK